MLLTGVMAGFQDAEFHKHMVGPCLKNMAFNLWSVTWMSLHINANERVALTGMTRLLVKPSKRVSASDKLFLLELNGCCLPACQLCTLHWMCTVCRPVPFHWQCLNQLESMFFVERFANEFYGMHHVHDDSILVLMLRSVGMKSRRKCDFLNNPLLELWVACLLWWSVRHSYLIEIIQAQVYTEEPISDLLSRGDPQSVFLC
jgi:hypothetical protein